MEGTHGGRNWRQLATGHTKMDAGTHLACFPHFYSETDPNCKTVTPTISGGLSLPDSSEHTQERPPNSTLRTQTKSNLLTIMSLHMGLSKPLSSILQCWLRLSYPSLYFNDLVIIRGKILQLFKNFYIIYFYHIL